MNKVNFKSKLPHVGTTIFSVITAEANKHNAINLAQGFPGFDCDAKLKTYVAEAMVQGKNQYAPMPGLLTLREALTTKFQKSQGIDLNPDSEITITAGATQGIFTALAAFVVKGDEVIIIEPAYDSYVPSILTLGAVPVFLTTLPPTFDIDWEELRSLISSKTKMIVINTPGNPSTKTWTKSDMSMLANIVEGTDIIILSDEVYEHLIFDGRQHISPLMIDTLRHRTLAVYSFGKTFHSTGWKVGYVVASSYLMTEFRKVHQYNVFSVNSFVQYGLCDYLADDSTWLSLPSFYQQKRDVLSSAMQLTEFKELPSEGSFFILYDYSAISEKHDLDFVYQLIHEHKVAAIPLSSFYREPMPSLKYIRLCFAKEEQMLLQAASQLVI
jgi:methionine transaminase